MIGILKSKKGSAVPLACAIVISLFLIFCTVMEYVRFTTIANGVRDALQAAVTSVSTENYDETYNGLREGYSGAYEKASNSPWQEKLDTGDIYAQLDELLGLKNVSGKRIKLAGGKTEYKLYGLSVNIANSPFAPAASDMAGRFTVDARLTVEVPLSLGWEILPPLKLTIKTKAGYMQKF